MSKSRTTTDIIRETIRQNRFGEYLLYSIAINMIAIGSAAMIVGMIRGQGLVGLAGGIESALFYPAMRSARRIREQNIAIQLLEIPLSIATTSKQAAEILNNFFQSTYRNQPTGPTTSPPATQASGIGPGDPGAGRPT